MVMGCGPGGTAAREEGLSTPRQLWLIRQQQSQQQINPPVGGSHTPDPGARAWYAGCTFGQLQGIMLRGDMLSTRGG